MQKLALLIGNTVYDDNKLGRLTAPSADIHALKKVLTRSEVGDFDEVKTLVNKSLGTVLREIGFLFEHNKRRGDFLLLYFSGHGILDASGELSLALKETRYDQLSGTSVPASFIKDVMGKSRSRRQVLILDCCHSGAFGRGAKGAKNALGTRAVTEATFEVRGYGREIMTSSAATQFSWQGDELIGGTEESLFTHFLVEGLDTGAAAPEGSDTITIEQLYHYVHDKVVDAHPNMQPQRWVDQQQGTFPIAKNPRCFVRSVVPLQNSDHTLKGPALALREFIGRKRDLLKFIADQQQRLFLFGFLVALGVGVFITFLDKSTFQIISLALISIIIIGLCGWGTYKRLSGTVKSLTTPSDGKPRRSIGRMVAMWVVAILVVAAGWGFVFRGNISSLPQYIKYLFVPQVQVVPTNSRKECSEEEIVMLKCSRN